MIVCVCHAVSHRTVLEVVASGAEDPQSIGRACGAGTDCGTCVPELRELAGAARAGKVVCAPGMSPCSPLVDGLSRAATESGSRRLAIKRTA